MIRFLFFFTLLISTSCTGTIKGKVDKDSDPQKVPSDVSVEKPTVPNWGNTFVSTQIIEGYSPKFLPTKDQYIFTDKNYNGLWIFDMHTKESGEITDARGAGYRPFILEDQIIYQKKGKKTSYVLFDLKKGAEQIFASRSEAILAALKNQENYKFVDLATDLNSLIIYEVGQKVTEIRPGNFSNYLNPSFSPDGQKILFEVSGMGGFVCGLDGEITHELGPLDNPSWVNEEEVVYARSEDDGMVKTKGKIYVQDIASKKEFLISQGVAQYLENPTAHFNGWIIISNTDEGQLILISKSKFLK